MNIKATLAILLIFLMPVVMNLAIISGKTESNKMTPLYKIRTTQLTNKKLDIIQKIEYLQKNRIFIWSWLEFRLPYLLKFKNGNFVSGTGCPSLWVFTRCPGCPTSGPKCNMVATRVPTCANDYLQV